MSQSVAVITDIHGNLPALEAALARIDELGIETTYCGGDLVGYGPWPNEVCRLIQEREIPTIYGNYDYAIGRDEEDCMCAYPNQHDRDLGQLSVNWTLEHTDQESKDFMRGLPFDLRFEVGGRRILLVHGSPRKVNEYLFQDKPAKTFERIAAGADCDVMVFGHTHKPWIHTYGDTLFVNCGSVGKPKDGDPRGGFAVLEQRGDGVDARIERFGYDAEYVPRRLPKRACPPSTARSCWSRPECPQHDDPPLPRRLLAEFLGSAFLAAVVIGSGIAAANLSPGDIGLQLFENAAATAAGLFTIILMFGPVSGGHFNPVVSLVDAHFGGLRWRDAFAYIPAQVAGCIAGAVVANGMFALAAISISDKHRASEAHLLAEVVATLGLLLVIFSLARTRRGSIAPAAVGAYIGAAYFFTSSTSFANPAISVGRMFSDTFAGIAPASVPAFIVAQLAGGLVAVGVIHVLYPDITPEEAAEALVPHDGLDARVVEP